MLKKNILLLVIIFASVCVRAQYMSVPTTIHTPYGNVTTYTNSYMPHYFGGSSGGKIPFKKHAYTVMLKNDSTITAEGKMHDKKGITILILKSKNIYREIYPADTKGVYIIGSIGNKIEGVPSFKDSCWLFKVADGKLSKYAIIPEIGTPYISAIQKGKDAPVVKITKENVIPLIEDNPKAIKKAKKDQLDVAIDIYNSSN